MEQGRPFVGRSGKLLETALRAVGIARENVYITNIVKEIPLNEEGKIRRPSLVEIEAWEDILAAEVQNTAPAAILALGRVASNNLTLLTGDIPFGSKVGNVYTAWHPSFLLHTGSRDYAQWLEQIQPWADAVSE
jgi:DNA polymerase